MESMTPDPQQERCRDYARKRIEVLLPVFARAAIGDFSEDVRIPEDDDEFSDLYMGVQIMLGVIREELAELERLNRTKSEFVSLASHQLRDPLTAIRWASESLLASKTPERQNPYVEEIHRTSLRLIRLVNELLSVSRLELGLFGGGAGRSHPREAAEAALADLLAQIQAKRLHVLQRYDPNLPELALDAALLRVVVQNLLANAVKYTPDGGRVELEMGVQGGELFIRVSDTGIGIPPREQPQVFEKFFRGERARRFDPDGAGLGLTMAKSIVEHSGGRIWFASERNRGTIFSVSLPVGPGAPAGAPAATAPGTHTAAS